MPVAQKYHQIQISAGINSSGFLDLASILCGSISLIIYSFWFFRDEYELLEAVQAKLAVHPLTCPILGNDHNEYRSRENPVRDDILFYFTFSVVTCFYQQDYE